MSAADRITQAATAAVSCWPTADREALLHRLAARPVVTPLNHGFSVDVGENYPMWCPDEAAVNKLLLERALLAVDVRTSA